MFVYKTIYATETCETGLQNLDAGRFSYRICFEVHCYKGKTGNSVERGLGANVKRLTENLHNNYHVYFDNFFMSIDLMLDLLRQGTYGCGTMRADRKGFPESLRRLVKTGLSNRGDHEMV